MNRLFLLFISTLISNIFFSQGEFCLTQQPDPPFGGYTSSELTEGDFNNDGFSDFCVQAINSNTVPTLAIGVLLSNGTGSYTSFTTHTVVINTTWSKLVNLTKGDFDGDGNFDLIVVGDQDSSFFLLKGSGTGNFSPPVSYSTSAIPKTLIAGDFNSDGKSDIVYSCLGSNTLSILYSNGTGFANPLNYTVSGNPELLVENDFDTNGLSDIYIFTGSNSYFLKQLQGGTFLIVNGPILNAKDIISIDVNSDTKPDLVYTDIVISEVGVVKGNGDFTFSSALSYSIPGLAGSTLLGKVHYGDYNSDGKHDLLVISSVNYMTLLPGVGDGSFSGPVSFSINSTGNFHLLNFLVANINNDSKPDIIALADDGGLTPICNFKFLLNCNTVGLTEERILKSSINLFPNPTNTGFHLNGYLEENVIIKIELQDLLGKVIYSNFNNSRLMEQFISLSDLKSGMYLLSLTKDKELIYTAKIVKAD